MARREKSIWRDFDWRWHELELRAMPFGVILRAQRVCIVMKLCKNAERAYKM